MADEDIEVTRQRELDHDIIYCKETVTSLNKGMIRENNYCTRLYSQEKISALLYSVGFSRIDFKVDFICRETEGDFGSMTNRMVVKGEKR